MEKAGGNGAFLNVTLTLPVSLSPPWDLCSAVRSVVACVCMIVQTHREDRQASATINEE